MHLPNTNKGRVEKTAKSKQPHHKVKLHMRIHWNTAVACLVATLDQAAKYNHALEDRWHEKSAWPK
jgi:hypothetical protein